jgi:hypothetical protein
MHRSEMEMELLMHLFDKSLPLNLNSNAKTMNRGVHAVGLRFRFLSLALHLLENDMSLSSVRQNILSEKIYQNAFHYFT